MLWPLGGVAYVDPPPRPGATLWSIAAGPLVNVALIPILMGSGRLCRSMGLYTAVPDLRILIHSVFEINVWLLIFNMLPIYPLDGGQILRSLLWFVMGRGRSLMVAAILGLSASRALLVSPSGRNRLGCGDCRLHADELLERAETRAGSVAFEKLPRRQGFACPACKAAPPHGRILEVRKMWAGIRYVPDAGGLSAVCDTISGDEVFGMRRGESDERVGGAGDQQQL